MKAAIEARALSSKGGGVKSYVKNLIEELDKSELGLVVLEGEESYIDAKNKEVVPLRHSGLLWWWLNRQIPGKLNELAPDVVHFTKTDVPVKKTLPTVVTVYDVIPLLFPETQRLDRRWYWPRAFERCVKHSDFIITISEASKRDIIDRLGADEEKVIVIQLAVDMDKFQRRDKNEAINIIKNGYGIERPYILFLGTRDKRKNVAAVLSAFEKISGNFSHDLVIAGKKALHDDGIEKKVKISPVQDRVKIIDYVRNEDLAYLYEAADLLVWPSVYEGWGYPPQEAMACGTPVVVSNGGSLPEVVGEAGVTVEYRSGRIEDRLEEDGYADRLAEAVGNVLMDEEKMALMAEMGIAQARSYTWGSVAEKTVEVYKQAVEQ